MNRAESLRLWQDVKVNHAKLDGCSGHEFVIDLDPEKVFGKRWGCPHCNGIVDVIAKVWYDRGRAHAAPAQEGA